MLRRLLVVLAVLLAAWVALSLVLFVFPPAETGAPRHADAVVVLSGNRNRLPPAERLIREHVARFLLISSVAHTPHWRAAIRLCRAGRYDGARVLCFEATPYSTQGEAEAVSRIARGRGWHRVVVVSSTFHLTRASLLFHRCFAGRLWFVGAPLTWWREPGQWADETSKLIYQLTAERSC